MAATIESLVEKIKSFPILKQRQISAILGATVADAATRSFHWQYNQQIIARVVGDKYPEFWPKSMSNYYHLPLGLTSNYNDIARASLESLSMNSGKIDIEHICENFKDHFGPGTEYAEALSRRPADRSKLPMEGRWVHGAMIHFLQMYEAKRSVLGSSTNVEYDGFCGALPVIIQLAGKDNMWDEASKVVALLNTNTKIVRMFHVASLLLGNYIMGETDPMNKVHESIKELYPDVYEIINDVQETKTLPYTSAVAKYGIACYLPGSFQGAILAMLKTSSYVDAVRLNILGGGCNCGRSNFIGACYGARYGIEAIPIEWFRKVTNIEQIMESVINVYSNDL